MLSSTRVRRLRMHRKYKRMTFYPVDGYVIPTMANNYVIFTKYKRLNITLSIVLTFVIAMISISVLIAAIMIFGLLLKAVLPYIPN